MNHSLVTEKPRIVDHSFAFDVLNDSPGIELLDYAYSTRKPSKEAYAGTGGSHIPSSTGITGGFPLGDSVYMKWRIKSTGEVVEDRVDLKGRLPSNMTDQEIYPVIDGRQLYVLLMPLKRFRQRVTTEEMNAADAAATTPLKRVMAKYLLRRVTQIYPDPITQLR